MNAPSDWFERFFSGLAVEFWRVAVPEAATLEETGFLWKHLSLSAGSRVLDVPCGDGRLSLALAAKGCAVTGVDISDEFLRAAEAGAREAGLSVEWRRSDMRDLPWKESFDAAFCLGNSFGFLDDAGNAAFLESAARVLVPEGRFVLDFGQTAESVFPRLEPRVEAEIGGFHFVEETRYDIPSARIENRYTISQGGQTEDKLASQRVYLASDVVRMLEDAGFEVLATFGSSAEEPFAMSAHRLLTVARRKTPLTPTLSRRERESGASGRAKRG